jgi:hypothetical protein
MQRHGDRIVPRIAAEVGLDSGGAQSVGNASPHAVHHEVVPEPAVGMIAVHEIPINPGFRSGWRKFLSKSAVTNQERFSSYNPIQMVMRFIVYLGVATGMVKGKSSHARQMSRFI